MDNNDQIRVEYVPLDELVRWPRNPKEHDLGSIDQSIQRFGFIDPLVLDERSGKLVAGHGRLDDLQARKARGSKPPKRIQERDGKWLVPVIRGVSFENESEAEAYLIASNRLVEEGGWDKPALATVLADLAAQGKEMLRGVGFDTQDLDQMLANVKLPKLEEEQPEEKLDAAEELLTKWGVESGDIWRVNNHLVICGDCRDHQLWPTVQAKVGQFAVHGAVTSPPYALQRKEQYGGVPQDTYVEWWDAVQENVRRVLEPDGSFFVNIKPNAEDGERTLYVLDLVLAMKRHYGWRFIDEFAWERISAPGSWPNRFKNGFEPVYQFALSTSIKFRPRGVSSGTGGGSKGGSNKSMGSYYNTAGKYIEWDSALPSNLLPSFGNATDTAHAAAFPVGLPQFFITAYSDPGDTWLDPFAGSGTVGVAAQRSGRASVLVELLPKYAAVILERLANECDTEPTKL